MKNKDDLLDDLEGFVDSDWKQVYEDFKQEEYKKDISEAVVPDYPTYRDFYNELVETIDKELPRISPRLARMIYFITRERSERALHNVDIFENLWACICRRERTIIDSITCSNCHRENVLVYYRHPIDLRGMWELTDYSRVNDRMESIPVHCINCGYLIYNVVGGKLLGVFSRRIYEQQSGDNF